MADVQLTQEDIEWMRSLYRESRSKTKAIPILAQCTGLTHAQVRAALGLPESAAKHTAQRTRALALLARGYTKKRVSIMVGVTPETLGIWAQQAREEGRHEM